MAAARSSTSSSTSDQSSPRRRSSSSGGSRRSASRLTDLEREWREQVIEKLDRIEAVASASATKVEVLSTKVDALDVRVRALEDAFKDEHKEGDAARRQIDLKLWGLVTGCVGGGLSLLFNLSSFVLQHWH